MDIVQILWSILPNYSYYHLRLFETQFPLFSLSTQKKNHPQSTLSMKQPPNTTPKKTLPPTKDPQPKNTLQNGSEYTTEDVSDLFKDLDKSELSEYMFDTNEKNVSLKSSVEMHKSEIEIKDIKPRHADSLSKLRSFKFDLKSQVQDPKKQQWKGLVLNEAAKGFCRSHSMNTNHFVDDSPLWSKELSGRKTRDRQDTSISNKV